MKMPDEMILKRTIQNPTYDDLKYQNGSMKSGCELELELIQTHMTQKPMLRVEVGALGARQAKN